MKASSFYLAILMYICLLFIGSPAAISSPASEVDRYIANFTDTKSQKALCASVENHIIALDQVKFELISGRATFLKFGMEKQSAMIFRGDARITYIPSDEIEQYQLNRFTGERDFVRKLDSLCIFFSDENLIGLDLSSFKDTALSEDNAEQLESAADHAFSHLGIFMPNKILGNLLFDDAVSYLYADMYVKNMGRFAFEYNPYKSDTYTLYKLIIQNGSETYDIISSFANDQKLVSRRDIVPIDITDYDIHSSIDDDGEMRVKCDVYYKALKSGSRCLYFNWYKGNEIVLAIDSNGDSLKIIEYSESFKILVNQNFAAGFSVVLNHPLTVGQSDHIMIEYDCSSIHYNYSLPYTIGNDCWYPQNHMRDPAIFHLRYDFPTNMRLVSSGEQMQYGFNENGDLFSVWDLNYPSCDISFSVGWYYPVELYFDSLPPVKIFTHSPVNVPTVGADMVNSLAFFTELFGKSPFDTVRVADNPGFVNGTSPGLENVSWDIFQGNSYDGPIRMANQWWHHIMRYESYRDRWIADGLAHYCALMFYEKSTGREKSFEDMMKDWQKTIFYGVGKGSKGYKAGPVVLGKRLNSSKSTDCEAVTGYKGAYIFHMIRYMLHDFNTGSDEIFMSILNNLLTEYQDKPITTEGLQETLESYLGDMSWFFDQWVYGTEVPTYQFSYSVKNDGSGKYQVICKIVQSEVDDGFSMIVPIAVNYDEQKRTYHKLLINSETNEIKLPLLPLEPKDIDFNINNAVLARVR